MRFSSDWTTITDLVFKFDKLFMKDEIKEVLSTR